MLLSQPIEKLGSIPVSRRTPVDSEKDIDDIVRWLRNGKDDSNDPTGEFEKIDQIVPSKPGQEPKDVPFGQHSTMLLSPPIEKLGSIPISFRTPEYREKEYREHFEMVAVWQG